MKKSLDIKLEKIASGDRSPKNFIIADAKDADMAGGIVSAGFDADGKPIPMEAYRARMREIVGQGIVDIMLMSVSNLEILSKEEGIFMDSAVTPAARANDTTDIWCARGSSYATQKSRPFSSASIDSIISAGANLALYSATFNNCVDFDVAALREFKAFRAEAKQKGLSYFFEVFNPNAPEGLPEGKIPQFVNDSIVRCLAGVPKSERPRFLKVAYNGPAAMEELAGYDSSIVVGVLGGSAGTSLDAFNLLYEAQKYGAMAALFGRKINMSESPIEFVECLRRVADADVNPVEAVKLYHSRLKILGIKPKRDLADDLLSTKNKKSY